MTDKKYSYCPGCGHITITKECDKLMQDLDGCLISAVGCSAPMPGFVDANIICMPHGRALPGATGIRLQYPDMPIIAYSGDGDALNIGIEHLVHSAARNMNLVLIIVNNSSFAMTGFQMSAGSPVGMKTNTCLKGRDELKHGIPIDTTFVQKLNTNVHLIRCHVTSKKGIDHFKEHLRTEVNYKGFSVIEVFSPCPTLFGNSKKSYEFAKEQYDKAIIPKCNCGKLKK